MGRQRTASRQTRNRTRTTAGINGDFNGRDFNKEKNVNVKDIRQGCPTIASGVDEDALSMAVSVKILTDMKIYNRLIDL